MGVSGSKAIDGGGGLAEDGGLLGGGVGGEEVAEEGEPVRVGAGGEEDGPVGGGEEAGGGEGFDDGFEVGGELGGGPVGGGFGDEAGEFAEDVGALGEGADSGGPGFEGSGRDEGFGDVVEDERLVGVAVYDLDGLGEVALEDEDVVDKVVAGEGADAGVEVFAEDEVGVGFGLEDVAEAFEGGVGGQVFEDLRQVGVDEGGPAYYSLDFGGLGGEVEEPVGLFEGLAGLDGDGSVDPGGLQRREEVGGEEVAAEGGERAYEPVELARGEVPEVVVGVDGLGHESRIFRPAVDRGWRRAWVDRCTFRSRRRLVGRPQSRRPRCTSVRCGWWDR